MKYEGGIEVLHSPKIGYFACDMFISNMNRIKKTLNVIGIGYVEGRFTWLRVYVWPSSESIGLSAKLARPIVDEEIELLEEF